MARANKKVASHTYTAKPSAPKSHGGQYAARPKPKKAEPKTKWKLQPVIAMQIAVMVVVVLGTAALLLVQQNQLYQTKREVNAITSDIQHIQSSIDTYQNELDFDLDMKQIKLAALDAGLRSPRLDQIKKIDFDAMAIFKEKAPIIDQDIFWTPGHSPSNTPNAAFANASNASESDEPDDAEEETNATDPDVTTTPTEENAVTHTTPETSAPTPTIEPRQHDEEADGASNHEANNEETNDNQDANEEDWSMLIPEEE